MIKITLVRISASENSFVFIDATKQTPGLIANSFGFENIADFVKSWTMGEKGILADGLVFVTPSLWPELDYQWDFYNCNGSTAEMCGNASRGMFIFTSRYLDFRKPILRFGTLSGPITVERINESKLKVQMPKWQILKGPFEELIDFAPFSVVFVNTGVPHIVIEVNDLSDKKINLKLARVFRYFDLAGPKGANVTFYQTLDSSKNLGQGISSSLENDSPATDLKNQISAVTFERGVEDFTKSCGTGAVAAALAFLLKSTTNNEVNIRVPGGNLKVIINFENQYAYLIGEARINYEIHFE
jgi:diaminopimelate epimerase